MNTWTSRSVVAAAVIAAGCSGTIGGPGDGSGDGPGPNGSGAGGSGAGNGAGASSGSSGTAGGGGNGGDPTVCIPGVPQTSQLPRLTRAQYDNTIRDLTTIDSQPSSMLAPDSTGSVDKRAWDGYKLAADTVANEVMASTTARNLVMACTTQDAACARQIIEQFGMRAFRRPLTPGEITRFENLFNDRVNITANGTFEEAITLIVRAFLLSPSFLTRAELDETRNGNYFQLTPYEVASRLSYMLWGSMPDQELFDAAAQNQLSTPEQLLAQAQRMLESPKARGMVTDFHRVYAHMGPGTRWAEVTRDTSKFQGFSPAVVPAMAAETERFFDYVVFEQRGTFRNLLTQATAFVNRDLAPLYGLDASQYTTELEQIELDPNERPGVFTRVGFLASHSLFDRTSPILRGAFLQKQILCRVVGSPPDGAESTPLPNSADLTTNRARVDAQTASPECATCHHTVINPTGFALEGYDAVGALQALENGNPIDTTATVPIGLNQVPVAGAADLMTAIADSPEGQKCYARHWVQFAYERSLTNEDSCTVDNIATKLTDSGYRVVDLIADLTQSDSFRFRAVPTEVAP